MTPDVVPIKGYEMIYWKPLFFFEIIVYKEAFTHEIFNKIFKVPALVIAGLGDVDIEMFIQIACLFQHREHSSRTAMDQQFL